MNPSCYTVYETSTLTRVYRLFRNMQLRHLPVIDLNNRVTGIITRKEL